MGQSRQAIKTDFFINILARLFETAANALSYFIYFKVILNSHVHDQGKVFVEKVCTVHVISPLFNSNIT